MASIANFVRETSTTTGTGDFTLNGNTGFRRFSDAFSTGGTDKFEYQIRNQEANEWEAGTGHLSNNNTLVRDTIDDSSNSNNAVDFSSGTKDVLIGVPAGHFQASLGTGDSPTFGGLNVDGSIDMSGGSGNLTLGSDLVAAGGETIWDESNTWIPQAQLENDTVTVAGNSVSLGNSTSVSHADLSNLHQGVTTSDSPTFSGASIDGALTVNESGASVDMRVEGDTDANLLFVDGSTDRVGVGTNSPSDKLDVNGSLTANGATFNGNIVTDADRILGVGRTSPDILSFANNGVEVFDGGDDAVVIEMDSNRSTADSTLGVLSGQWNETRVAEVKLRGINDATNKDEGQVTITTAGPGGALGERLRINENGSGGPIIIDSSGNLDVNGGNVNDASRVEFNDADGDGNKWAIKENASNGGLDFESAGSDQWRLSDVGGWIRSLSGWESDTGTNAIIDSGGRLEKDSSARRFKTDIKDWNNPDILMNFQPKHYKHKKSGKPEIGLIAEQVYDDVGEEFITWADSERTELQSVRYDRLVTPLIAGYQNHQKEIRRLKNRIQKLENEVE